MESSLNEQPHLQPGGNPDNNESYELKHADSDSVNSIPPPPPPVGLVVPVASEESCDITEAERLRQQDSEQHTQKQQLLPQKKGENEGQSDNCCEKILKCLGLIPCPSLLSWIILMLGIGCLTGSLLTATWRTRDLLKDHNQLWFMEYTVIGAVVGMFTIGTLFLAASHLCSEPTSRRVFNSFTKNRCAQGLNIFVLVMAYLLALCWILITAILSTPLVIIITIFLADLETFDPKTYGFNGESISGAELETFKEDAGNLLVCYGIAFFAAILIANSMVCFIMCITANITHLRDNRFATLNAYGSEEVRNSKHSVLDTNM